MKLHGPLLLGLLAGAAAVPAWAQTGPAPASVGQPVDPAEDEGAGSVGDEAADDEDAAVVEEVVVTAQRRRGAALGDIPPEFELNAAEIRALGAGSITELLETLEPQIRSNRGRGGGSPVVMLNGRRISGFSVLRGIPPEATERCE